MNPIKLDAYVIEISRSEMCAAIQQAAKNKMNTGHQKGNFRFAFIEADKYDGFKVTFVKSETVV